MAVLNVKPSKGKNYGYGANDTRIVETYIRYITRTRSSYGGDQYPPAYVGSLGFKPFATVEELVEGFFLTQSIYRVHTGIRARHEWISFKDGETVDLNGIQRVAEIAYWFARWYYNQGYQVVFAIHTDTEHLHIHYVINSVNFITGRKYHSNTAVLNNERAYLNDIICWLTGKCESAVELSEYTDCFDGLMDENLLSMQRYMPVVIFPYDGSPQIVY